MMASSSCLRSGASMAHARRLQPSRQHSLQQQQQQHARPTVCSSRHWRRGASQSVAATAAGGFRAPSSSSAQQQQQQPDNPHALAVYSLPLGGSAALMPAPRTASTSAPPALRWSTQMWFEAMVQTVVKQLDGGAFLLRVGFSPGLSLQLIRLEAADLAAGWDHIQRQHLSAPQQPGVQDEAVILVHPLADEQQPCVVHQMAGEACPGCPHTTQQQPHPGAAAIAATAAADAAASSGGVTAAWRAVPPPASVELLHGRLGDCCGEEEGSGEAHGHHHHHHHAHEQQPAAPAAAGASPSSTAEQQQQSGPAAAAAYYGMVVQCRDSADALQGCYLLKTVQQGSAAAGASPCHCTHYSLNKVCKGPSLEAQFQAAWLVV